MAKNKAKMNKFLTGAITATMVATAVAPVGALAADESTSKFTDISGYDQSTQDKINALNAQGIVNGTSDTTFAPSTAIKRGQVVKLLGRYLVESGIAETPADWNTKQRFTDVPVNFSDQDLVENAAIVYDAGVFQGSNGVLNTAGEISRQNMALVLDRAAEAITGKSFVDLAEGKDSNVADVNTAKAEARNAIKALNALEISTVENFRPAYNVSRANFATFLFNAIEVIDSVEIEEVKVESVSAINTTTVEVVFDQAVNADKAKFEVKKGNSTVAIAQSSFNDDNTVAYLELNAKISEGTYAVSVTGLTEDVISSSFEAQDERVESIEFLSESLVLGAKVTDVKSDTEATAAYRVLNQYGEDISKTSLASGFRFDTSLGEIVTGKTGKGLVTINKMVTENYSPRLGDSVVITIVDTDSGKSASQVLKVSDEAKVSEITFGEVVSSKKSDLTEDTVDFGTYYLPFEAKDQYGFDLTDADKIAKDLLTISSNPMIASVKTVGNEPVVVEIEVDGKDTFAFVLDFGMNNIQMAGTSTITAISKSTGKQGTADVEVGPGLKVDKITLGNPAGVVKGDAEILVPVEAYDTEGNLVEKITLLDKLAKNEGLNGSVNVSGNIVGNPEFVEKDGKFYLKFKTEDVADASVGIAAITITTSTQEVATKTLQVQPNARPFAIVGLKDGVSNTVLANNPEYTDYFIAGDFLVEDQYGDPLRNGYQINVSLPEEQQGKGFTLGGEDENSYFNINVAGRSLTNSFSIEANDYFVDGQNMNPTSATFTFELLDSTGQPVKDKYGEEVKTNPYVDIRFNATEVDAFASYEATSFATIYFDDKDVFGNGKETPTAYERTLKVYGVTDAGKKVQLPASAFKVKDQKNVTTNLNTNKNQYELSAKTNTVDYNKDTVMPDTADASLVVVINHTGEEILVEGTVSAIPPVVKTIDFLDSATHNPVSYIDAANSKVTMDDLQQTTGHYAVTVDQYGISTSGASVNFESITFTKLESKTAVIKDNGTDKASVDKLQKGDIVQAEVSIDGVKKTIQIKAKSDAKPEDAVATVSNQTELQLALNNGYTNIHLNTADWSSDAADNTATIETGQSGEITITKDGVKTDNPTKLVVNAPNATVTVDEGQFEEVTIDDVDNNSFIIGAKASVDTILVNDDAANIVNNSETQQAPTVTFNTAGTFTLGGKFGAISASEAVTLQLADEATVDSVTGDVTITDAEDNVEDFSFTATAVNVEAGAEEFNIDVTEAKLGSVAVNGEAKDLVVKIGEDTLEANADDFVNGSSTITVETEALVTGDYEGSVEINGVTETFTLTVTPSEEEAKQDLEAALNNATGYSYGDASTTGGYKPLASFKVDGLNVTNNDSYDYLTQVTDPNVFFNIDSEAHLIGYRAYALRADDGFTGFSEEDLTDKGAVKHAVKIEASKIKVQAAIDEYKMNSLARYLGALGRIDNTPVESITYNGVTYTWNESLEAKGSKWVHEDGSTLVSAIVQAQSGAITLNHENGASVEITYSETLPTVQEIENAMDDFKTPTK